MGKQRNGRAHPGHTLEELRDTTANDSELSQVFEGKRRGDKMKEMSKWPYANIWYKLYVRDGLLIRNR